MAAVSMGCRTLKKNSIGFEGWLIACGDGAPSANPKLLEDWTYYQPVQISTRITLDLEELLKELALSTDAVLGVSIVWVCPSSSLRGSSDMLPMVSNEAICHLIINDVAIRGQIDLHLQVILLNTGSGTHDPLAPRVRGTVLWSTKHSVRLEGVGARLPIVSAPFGTQRLPGSSGHWYLQFTGSSLDAPVDAILRLWVNDQSTIMRTVLDDPDGPSAEIPFRFMQYDMYRQLLQKALTIEDFDLQDDFPEGSFGAALTTPLRILGYDNINDARSDFAEDATLVEARLQAAVEVD